MGKPRVSGHFWCGSSWRYLHLIKVVSWFLRSVVRFIAHEWGNVCSLSDVNYSLDYNPSPSHLYPSEWLSEAHIWCPNKNTMSRTDLMVCWGLVTPPTLGWPTICCQLLKWLLFLVGVGICGERSLSPAQGESSVVCEIPVCLRKTSGAFISNTIKTDVILTWFAFGWNAGELESVCGVCGFLLWMAAATEWDEG